MAGPDDLREHELTLGGLATALAELEERVARLEGGGPATADRGTPATPQLTSRDAEPDDAVTAAEARGEVASLFASGAAASFCLLGALALRAVARKGWLPPVAGTAAGLVYASALALLPHVWRQRPFLQRHGPFVQVCGVLLAPLVVVEMARSSSAPSIAQGALLITLITLLGGLFADATGRRFLAITSTIAGIVGILSLGTTAEGAVARAAGLTASAGAALVIAARRGWSGLRPLALVPVALALGLALLVTAQRPGIPSSTGAGLLVALLALWGMLVVNHVVHARRLDAVGAAWLPVASVWIVPIALWASPLPVAIFACGGGVLLLAAAGLWSRARPLAAATRSAAVGSTLAGAAALWPAVAGYDPSGVGTALLALPVAAIGSASASAVLVLASEALVLGATVLALFRAHVADVAAASAVTVTEAVALALATLAFHRILRAAAARQPGRPGRAVRVSRALALLVVLVFAFLAARALLWLVGGERWFGLGQTLLLTATSVVAALLGRHWENRVLHVYGGLAAALLALKVLGSDLANLSGAGALTSIAVSGLCFLGFSLSLRARTRAGTLAKKRDAEILDRPPQPPPSRSPPGSGTIDRP